MTLRAVEALPSSKALSELFFGWILSVHLMRVGEAARGLSNGSAVISRLVVAKVNPSGGQIYTLWK